MPGGWDGISDERQPGQPKRAPPRARFVFVIIGITVYQENKTENALQALKDLSSPLALSVRPLCSDL